MTYAYIREHLDMGNKEVKFKHLTYNLFATLGGLWTVMVTNGIDDARYTIAHNVDTECAASAISEDMNEQILKQMQEAK